MITKPFRKVLLSIWTLLLTSFLAADAQTKTQPKDTSANSMNKTIEEAGKGDALYAIIVGKWPGTSVLITSLAQGQAPAGKITSVTMLGAKDKLTFTQEASGLKVNLPAAAPCDIAYTLKITGLKMNPTTATDSGNPMVNNGGITNGN